MKNKTVVFVSPHSKKIGETYILPRLVRESVLSQGVEIRLFNATGEWDDVALDFPENIVNNPFRWIARLAPNIESINPWLNYRVWLFFASVAIIIGLPVSLFKLSAKGKSLCVVARMATSAVAIASYFSRPRSRTTFVASMAGVPLPSSLRRVTWPRLYRAYEVVVTPCEDMVPSLVCLVGKPKSKFVTIANPVLDGKELVPFEEHLRDRDFEKGADAVWRLLAVGRLTRQKGFDLLLNSLSRVSFDFHLTLIGDGELERELKYLAMALQIEDKIDFCGYDPNPFAESDRFDLFVMPSRWEGPGHTIIEALARGIPSIVSDCGYGPSETVGHGRFGTVFQLSKPNDLENQLEKLIQNYSASRERLKNCKPHLSRYTVKNVYNEWSKFCRQVL